jgi:TRAP-type C4-dicarboxylate transport system permease small subunit
MILASFIIGLEVILRKFFNTSIGGADELSGYALAIGSAWSLGYALLDRAHIRIDSLYVILPRAVRAVLDVIALAGFLVFFTWLTVRASGVLRDTIEMGSHSVSPLGTPLVYPEALWVAGLVVLVIVSSLLLVHVVLSLLRGDYATVHKWAGSKSATEEVEEELTMERELSSEDKR